MFLGMVCMAAVIVIFAAINYKKQRIVKEALKEIFFKVK